MIPLHRLAFVAAVALCGCGGAKDPTVTAAPLSAASAPASGAAPAPVVVAPPATPVTAPAKVATLALPALTSAWDHQSDTPRWLPRRATARERPSPAPPGLDERRPTIATVDAAGFVTPIRAGFTTITVSADGVTASGTLSVRGTTRIPARSQYVGINLSGIAYYSSEFPFADLMKSGMGWVSRDDNGVWGAAFPSLTADGYPAALAAGQHALSAVAWAGSHFAPGRYVVLWDGDGSISFPLSSVTVAESAPNRIALDIVDTTGNLWVAIDRTSATNPVRNLRFLWPGTETIYAHQPFSPVFLEKIAPFALLRFMDWGATNGSPVVEWADRAHLADVTWATPAGVPIETMIELANTLHVDPWFCIPHQASDDYVRQFATLLRARLDPALHAHIEYSNEVEHGIRPDHLGECALAGARSAEPVRPAGDLLRDARGADLQDHPGRVRPGRERPHRARPRRPGDVGQLPHPHAGLPGHRRQRRRDGDDTVLQRVAAGDPANVATTLTLSSDQIVDQMLANIRGDINSAMTNNAALAATTSSSSRPTRAGPVTAARTSPPTSRTR